MMERSHIYSILSCFTEQFTLSFCYLILLGKVVARKNKKQFNETRFVKVLICSIILQFSLGSKVTSLVYKCQHKLYTSRKSSKTSNQQSNQILIFLKKIKGLNIAEADIFTAEYIQLNKNQSCIREEKRILGQCQCLITHLSCFSTETFILRTSLGNSTLHQSRVGDLQPGCT